MMTRLIIPSRVRGVPLSTALLCCVLSMLIAPRLHAQDAERERIHEWIVREWNEAAEWPNLSDLEFRFRIVNPAPVEPKPGADQREHWTRYRVWTGDDDQVRFSTDEFADDEPVLYFDVAVNGSAAWSISPEQVVIVDDTREAESAHQYQRNLDVWERFTSLFLHGGFAPANASPIPPEFEDVEMNGDRWSFIVPSGSERTQYRFSGRWDEHLDRGFVERIDHMSNADRAQPQEGVTLIEGWAFDETADRWIADSATMFNRDGKPFYRIEFEEAVPFDSATFAELMKTPSLDANAADPIRGPITATSVLDYRHDAWQQRAADGSLSQIAPIQNSGMSSVTIAGRVILVLVGGLVVLVVVRRFRPKTEGS